MTSTNPVIPVEAVEAAALSIQHANPFQSLSICRDEARAALEAAAPHMLAAAWEKGRLVGRAEEQSGFDTEMNPYGDPYRATK